MRLRGTLRQWLNGSDIRYSTAKRSRRRIRGKRKAYWRGKENRVEASATDSESTEG